MSRTSGREKSSASVPAHPSIAEGAGAAETHRKKLDASPKLDDWKREFGNKVKVNERTGEYSLNLRDNADIKKAMQMQEGSRRIDVERGQEIRSKERKERIQRRDGHVLDFPEHLIDQTKHKGIRPVGRGGKSAALHFGFSESAADYVRGPEGMYFIWDDGWCPTTLWYKGTAPQHDPDGNLWVLKDGEWVLESEVEGGD